MQNKMINNNYSQFAIDDFYTQQPIEQHTDNLANQTSFCLHLHNAYGLVQKCFVNQVNEFKCKYCKAFYFPPTINKKNNDSMQLKKQTLKKMIEENEETKTYPCELCGSINDISKSCNFLNNFPKFHDLKTKQKDFHYNSHFQSVIVSQTKLNNQTATKIKSLAKDENEIIFVFCIDLGMLSQTIQLNNLTYFKTVVMEFFGRHIQNKSHPNQQHQQGQQQPSPIRQKQNYKILITFSMNSQFFVADLNTVSTICADTLLKERAFSTVPSENTKQIVEKESQRKENLIELLHKSSVKVDTQESIERFGEYMDLLIEERNESNSKMRLSVNGSANFTKLMQLLSFDKSPYHSYIVSWISSTPVLNYQPHRVKKSNIYSLTYLFCQKSTQNKETSKSFLGQGKFEQSNVRNQLLVVRDNNEVRFINVSENEESYEFYYLLYELFAIVDSPKMFRPRWMIKTDSKYPPILTNDPPLFFIKNPTMLYFIVSSLIDKGGHSKFQVSVQFQDWKKDEYVWIINWTKDSQKQSIELKGNSHKQIQVIPKMPQIYNYFHILVKYMMNAAIRGKTDLTEGKRQLMSLNTVTGHQFSVIIESIINHGVFRANNIEIGIEYLSKLYEYLSQFKGIPFEVLRFLSCSQYNVRRAVLMMFPFVIRTFDEEERVKSLVYWAGGYAIIDDYESQNENFETWCEDTMSVINEQYEGKYFTRRFPYNNHQKSLSHEDLITLSYLTKSGFLQTQKNNQIQDYMFQNSNRSQPQNKNPHLLIDRTLAPCINLYFQDPQDDTEQNPY